MTTNGNGSDHIDRDTPEQHPFVLREEHEELLESFKAERRDAFTWRRHHAAQLADLTEAVHKMGSAVFQLVALPGDVAANAKRIDDAQRQLERIKRELDERRDDVDERLSAAERDAKLALRAATMGSDATGELAAVARAQADAARAQAEALRLQAEVDAKEASAQAARSDSWRARKAKWSDGLAKFAIPAIGTLIVAAAGVAVALLERCH